MSNLVVRILTGTFFVGLILGAVYFNASFAILVFTLFAFLGIREYYGLFKEHTVVNMRVIPNVVMAMLFFTYVILNEILHWRLPISSVKFGILSLFLSLLLELWKRESSNALINSSVRVFGIVYVILPFLIMSELSFHDPQKTPILAGFFLIIWSNDSFAYLTGRFFGKRKLFERISPKKTWEGTLGGVLFALTTSLVIGYFAENILYWLVSGILIAPAAILGDLIESQFKRSLNLKDSGSILPGHGGILDRFDSVFLAAPIFFVWNEVYHTYFSLFAFES